MMRVSLFRLLIAAGTIVIASQWGFGASGRGDNFGKCPSDYGYQGSYNFARDVKSRVTIERLEAISAKVRDYIIQQLRERVGADFSKRLHLDYGYLVDFDSTQELKANDDSRIDGYDLSFKVSDKASGLKAYWFKVVANGSGKLIDELALPDVASTPEKARLIGCSKARTIAQKNGFPKKRSSIYFGYGRDTSKFVWEIVDSQAVEPDAPKPGELPLLIGQGTFRHVLIDANTGSVIRIYKETIVV